MQAVAAFVQTQYREANGVRMQTAQPGVGVRWRSNVAHSGTGRFTLLHADGERGGYGDGREVMTAWLLGNAPCSTDGPLASRICVRGAASCGCSDAVKNTGSSAACLGRASSAELLDLASSDAAWRPFNFTIAP